MHQHRGLKPNRGRQRARRRPPADDVTCVVSGTVRFVDGGGRWVALAVRDASSAGRRLVGSTITLDLGGARLSLDDRNGDGIVSLRDLLPGDHARVTVRLPRAATAAPSALRVRRLSAVAPAAPGLAGRAISSPP